MTATSTERPDRNAAAASMPLEVKPVPAVAAMAEPASGVSRMDDIVIGSGVTSTGNFTTGGELCVDGVLKESEVNAATLSISSFGEFHGKALVRHVEVFGRLSGEVIASEQVVLRASAIVSGKISAPCIVMHRGATMTGEIETLKV